MERETYVVRTMVSNAKPRCEQAEGLPCSNHGHHDICALASHVVGFTISISCAVLDTNRAFGSQLVEQAGGQKEHEYHEYARGGSSNHFGDNISLFPDINIRSFKSAPEDPQPVTQLLSWNFGVHYTS